MKAIFLRGAILVTILGGLGAKFAFGDPPKPLIYVFQNLSGPAEVTKIAEPVPATIASYTQGSYSRLAILLTDKASAWMGLAHGLKSIGIPFTITQDYREALKHKVVYVYPRVTGTNLPEAALSALSAFPAKGGTLIVQHALGGGVRHTLGFEDAVISKNMQLRFDPKTAAARELTDPGEQIVPIGGMQIPILGFYAYTGPKFSPVATYEDGSAAITRNADNTAYAFGMDVGHLLLKGYNNRQQDIAQHYVNAYEPTLDVLLRCIKTIYLSGEKSGVTLATVPEGKSLSVLLTHDIDYPRSMGNALDYAAYERARNITASYFMQVKYVRDWNDEIFFNEESVRHLRKLQDLGMEIGSHSVAHSFVMRKFPMGDGTERYPSYTPFVKDRMTTFNGTVLGELRVSKFMLEHFVPGLTVESFRPGHLSNSYLQPEAMVATRYRYSSSVTANDSLTHLPFQLTYSRGDQAEVPVFEFPVTIEDESDPPMLDRLPQALDLAKKLERYGGLFNILIHPDILGQKLEFEKGFVEAMGNRVWYGSVGQFGNWWAARDKVGVDVTRAKGELVITLSAPDRISGLALDVPAGAAFVSSNPKLKVTQRGNRIVIANLSGKARLTFRLAD